jgi:ubiquinone/menaquinone biosynthesis C-methylase UbiE
LIDRLGNITHHTVDLFMDNVDFKSDITNMPEIASGAYDVLVCSHVLEHVSDDRRALSELFRVLKAGGWGIVMAPINLAINQIDEDPDLLDESERWRRFAQHDHVRMYSKQGFIKRLEGAGFSVSQLGMAHFGASVFSRYGITDRSVLYVVEKK